MMLAVRLETIAKEATCLQARLDEQAKALRTCQTERMRLESELAERDERVAVLEARVEELAQARSLPEPTFPPPTMAPSVVEAPAVEVESAARPSRPAGLLGRFKRGRKADDAPVSEPCADVERELEPEPLPEAESAPEIAPVEAPTGPAIVAKRFAPQEFLRRLPDLDDTQLDLLNFGVAQLDDDGVVIALNHRECLCTGVARPDALDRDYFTDVLSTADGASLNKKLSLGAAKGKLDTPILTALNEGEATVRAIVHLYRHNASKTNWALVRRESDGK